MNTTTTSAVSRITFTVANGNTDDVLRLAGWLDFQSRVEVTEADVVPSAGFDSSELVLYVAGDHHAAYNMVLAAAKNFPFIQKWDITLSGGAA